MRALRQASVGAGLVAVLVALAGTGAPAASGAPSPRKPNIVVLMSDDQTAVSQSMMTRTNELIGAPGGDVHEQLHQLAAVLPIARDLPHRPVRPQPHRARQHAPFGGFDRLDTAETLPVWLQSDGYYTAQIGKFLNGYEDSDVQVPPGWSEWHGTKRTYTYYGEQLLEDGQVVTYGSTSEDPDNPANPAAYSTDLYTAKAVDVINRRAPAISRSSSTWPTSPRTPAGPTSPPTQPQSQCEDTAKPRSATSARSPTSRCRRRRTSTRPTSPTSRPGSRAGRVPHRRPDRDDHAQLPLPARVAARRRRGRRRA